MSGLSLLPMQLLMLKGDLMNTKRFSGEDELIHISSASDGSEVYYDPSRGMYCVRVYFEGVLKYETWFDEIEPTPKKPILIDGRMKCPRCKKNWRTLHHYCDVCGQAIDWSDVNE